MDDRNARTRQRTSGEGSGRRVFSLAMVVLPLVASACIAEEPAPRAAVVIRVSVPAIVRAGEARDIVATISNSGTTPVLILPNMVRLRVEGQFAQYVPYPGPPVDPWQGARELAPGANAPALFPDTSDKRGIWSLPPGDYRVIALYEVPQDLAAPPAISEPTRVWRGRVESPPVSMTVSPTR